MAKLYSCYTLGLYLRPLRGGDAGGGDKVVSKHNIRKFVYTLHIVHRARHFSEWRRLYMRYQT
jgi:hypothetical protein